MPESTIARVLTRDQNRRAAALHEARAVLAARGFSNTSPVDAMDAYHLASFILDGHDPWSRPSTAQPEGNTDV